ncbi:MAG: hypothetical protein OEV44_00790 [Spirochaetota bacterium]|nr:hypothetical protein [Spirochaetota bacterium]
MNLEKIINIDQQSIKRLKQDVNDIEVLLKGQGVIYNPDSKSIQIYTKFGYSAVTEFQDNIFKELCKENKLSKDELEKLLEDCNLDNKDNKKIYYNIPYGNTIDTYKFLGVQECIGLKENFNLYQGLKYHHTLDEKRLNNIYKKILKKQ